MYRNRLEQEQYCRDVRALCYELRTKLFLIDNLKNFDKHSRYLKRIISEVDDIYWSL